MKTLSMPCTMARIETKTATVSATPNIVISVPTRRTVKLRRLYLIGIKKKLLPPAPYCLCNWNPRGVPSWKSRAGKRNHQCDAHGQDDRVGPNFKSLQKTARQHLHVDSTEQGPCTHRPEKAARNRNDDGFKNHHRQDGAWREA